MERKPPPTLRQHPSASGLKAQCRDTLMSNVNILPQTCHNINVCRVTLTAKGMERYGQIGTTSPPKML